MQTNHLIKNKDIFIRTVRPRRSVNCL